MSDRVAARQDHERARRTMSEAEVSSREDSSVDVSAPAAVEAGQRPWVWQGRTTRRRDVVVCLLLGVASLLIYQANLRSIAAVDTYAARYLPFSIWRSHTLVLDPIVEAVAQGRRVAPSESSGEVAWWVRGGRGNHLVSFYPVVVPVVVAPLYWPAVAYLETVHWDPLEFDRIARIMEKVSASLIAATSVALIYLLLRRRSDAKTAALLALVFALGTTTWVISSQALWMHGLGTLLIVATLLLLTGAPSPVRAATAGFLCSLIACNRQPDVILAAGLALYGLWWARRTVPVFLAAATLPVALVLGYNVMVVGHLLGGYGLVSQARLASFLHPNVFTGVAGLLVSPTHGLFVFSPFLLFIPVCLRSVVRDRGTRPLTLIMGGAAVLQLVLYGFGDWRQGMSWGPRWLTDMLPILFWMLPPVVAGLSAASRVVFGFACAVAIAIQAVGAFWYTGASDATVLAAEGADTMRAAWDLRNAPFLAELRHRRAPADLLVDLQGNVDLVTVHDDTHRQVEVHGWALTNHRSPSDVAIRLDGRLVGGTSALFDRPDVVRTLGEKSPAGWRITFAGDQVAPGEHVVSVLVRAREGGEPRLLKTRTINLAVGNEADRERALAAAAHRAASRIAERQQAGGYWLTAFTNAPRFADSHQELNTFTNAVMLDMAGPVAEATGLSGVLARARGFLESQIEAGGLVRYHGRPDAPTIGTLGCAITPDTDDTALVWRVAPGRRPELRAKALATLARFRTPEGLYRTWLAPQADYQCIDPGSDPNPPDIAIQIHVLMLLAQADPTAARGLCATLQRRASDEGLWVYYRMAPPLIALRLTDLQRIGCPVQLSPARLRPTVAGQAIWSEAAERLRALESRRGGATEYSETADLLGKLAAEDFSLVAHDPPLLYHNDLSASVPRFYWSEEFGYALWLRLYFENERARARRP